MAELLRLVVHNYRCLRDVDFAASNINVVFGANGVGKSTFLDALWFVRECAHRGTAEAASLRHHGIGALADNAEPGDDRIDITNRKRPHRAWTGPLWSTLVTGPLGHDFSFGSQAATSNRD